MRVKNYIDGTHELVYLHNNYEAAMLYNGNYIHMCQVKLLRGTAIKKYRENNFDASFVPMHAPP